MIDAQRKKPKVPVHALVTAHIRWCALSAAMTWRKIVSCFASGCTLPKWTQTTTPYLFLHTPDIAQAPELVDTLWSDLRAALPEIGAAPSIPQQTSLF
jgi:uncharacterized protein YecE (DUF72 family)